MELKPVWEQAFSTLTTEEVVTLFQEHDVMCVSVNALEAIVDRDAGGARHLLNERPNAAFPDGLEVALGAPWHLLG